MLGFHKGLKLALLASVLTILATAQTNGTGPSTTGKTKRTVRVGIAVMNNRSFRAVSPTWERDQLVRSLHRLRTDKKSNVEIEAVALESSSREDAGAEAAKKDCRYFVLTTLLDPGRPGSILVGSGDVQAPLTIGNANPARRLDMNFVILEVGEFRAVADGTTSATEYDNDDNRSADEAMGITALRVAGEIRKHRPPNID
jgi:hypothetical protein